MFREKLSVLSDSETTRSRSTSAMEITSLKKARKKRLSPVSLFARVDYLQLAQGICKECTCGINGIIQGMQIFFREYIEGMIHSFDEVGS